MLSAISHDVGRHCPLNNALRILHTRKAMRLAYSCRSQFAILSGPTNLGGLRFDRTFHTRSSDTSINSGESFSKARWVMVQDRWCSLRGSRNALFIAFAIYCDGRDCLSKLSHGIIFSSPSSINQLIILFSDAGYKSDSHEADVYVQLTNKMWNNWQNNLENHSMVFEQATSQ